MLVLAVVVFFLFGLAVTVGAIAMIVIPRRDRRRIAQLAVFPPLTF
jgi:hypothetical protein